MFHKKTPVQPNLTTRELGEVVERLSENNLVFPIIIPHTTIYNPWQIIDRTLHEQLEMHGIQLPRRDGDVGDQFTRLSWDVMAPKKSRRGQIVKYTFQTGTAGPTSFTADFLREQALPVDLGPQTTDVQFILIGLSLYSFCLHHLVIPSHSPQISAPQRPHSE
jgi:hypothetical protein